jgi:predicted metalloprotease with PDZ domain
MNMTSAPLKYQINVDEPWTHHVKVLITGKRPADCSLINFYLPIWSPGSYKVRDYSRHVRRLRVLQANGEFLFFEKKSKCQWQIDWDRSELSKAMEEFTIEYEVYCNEVTVRTSHVNLSHAFLHGPSLFMGIEGFEDQRIELAVNFPPCWTKVTTSLKDISPQREKFLYEAMDYDELLDTPIEIGTHDTSGFRVAGIDHHLAFLNWPSNMAGDLRIDTQKIVQKISDFWGEIPYESYAFIGHFFPKTYGGLEHHNSTAVQFDPFEVGHLDGYRDFLGLLAHEYFHTWNVKRVRPLELGPFNYKEENYTRMHWLTEGFTSFVDDIFVFNCDLSDEKYFLKGLTKKINFYQKTPGRFFDSIEEASFDAWIKLYQPHENSRNATVNYYLKGALIFFCLNSLMALQGRHLKDFARELWALYKMRPNQGVTKDEVLEIIKKLCGQSVCDEFESYITETGELPLEEACERSGLEAHWQRPEGLYWGCDFKKVGDNIKIESIVLDGPAHKCGLNHGDEFLAYGGWRLTYDSLEPWQKSLKAGHSYEILINRQGRLLKIEVAPEKKTQELEKLTVKDRKKFEDVLRSF